jgi:hypothetical protein
MNANKKKILAASLALLWGGLAVWQWRILDEPVRVPLTNVTGSAVPNRSAESRGTVLRVNLARLASMSTQREATVTVPRNIFALPNPDGTLPFRNDSAHGSQQGSVPAERVAEQGEVMESGPYRYLGYLRVGKGRQENKALAVLSKDDEVLVLKVGDRVDSQLVLKAITSESVTMRDLGTRADQTVYLSEEAPSQE